MRLWKRVLFLLVGVLLLGSGCRAGQQKPSTSPATPTGQVSDQVTAAYPEPTIKPQVIVLHRDSASTLDPYVMVRTNLEESIAAHIWDALVWINDDLEVEPRLAESWRLVDDLTWEISLRQGVTFQNGEAFDAEAVKYSLERAVQLENSVEPFASSVALQDVEIVNDHTVRIHTGDPVVSMIYRLSSVEMLPPAYYGQTPLEDLARNPVGSGPYRLVGWDPGERIVLEANPDYWQGVPAVQNIVFQTEPDADKRLTGLVSGDADLISDLTPDQAEAANTESTRLMAIESTRRLFVGFHIEDGTPVADKRVRQALNYGVNVPALVAEFHAGYGRRYGSWVNPPNADPSLTPWPYDPEKARALLAQAGYPEGMEMVLDTPDGRTYRDREIAAGIADQLAEIGVEVTIQQHDWSTYVSERLIPKETATLFLLSLMSRGNDLEDARNLAYGFPFNPTLWHNEEFEQLLSEAEQTFNQKVRSNLLLEAQGIAFEEAPWIWLWRPFLFYGVGQGLDSWQPRADGLIYLYVPAPVPVTE
jgi:peptide/nickel transport system substrate-binding protein